MRPWAWVRRVLALAVTLVFVLGVTVAPAFAAAKSSSRSFSSPKSSTSSGSRSFSSPKTTTPSTPSRSYSTPKTTTPKTTTPPKSYSSPAPSTTPSTPKSYSTPTSPSYSGSDRSYSTQDRSFSSQRPSTSRSLFGSTPKPTTPPVEYDVTKSRYPTRPPVIVYAPTPGFDPWYWQDYYYGRPWYWRMWHRPVYYSTGFGLNWWPIVIAGGIGIWILLAVLAARANRRRH